LFSLPSTVNRQLSTEQPRLLLWSPVGLMLGIGGYFRLSDEPAIWAGPLALAVCMVLLVALRRHSLRWLVAPFLLVALGFCAAEWRSHVVATPLITAEAHGQLEGVIDEIELTEDKTKLVIAHPVMEGVAPEKMPKRVRVTVRGQDPDWQAGDRVRMNAALFPLPAPDMPGAYDFGRHFYFRSIGAVGFAMGAPEMIASNEQSGIRMWLNNLRHHIGEDMRAHMQGAVGDVAAAMTVGESGPIPEEVKDALRNSGLAHMLAIAGLHLGIVAGIVFFVVRLLLTLYPPLAMRVSAKKIAAVFGLAAAAMYLSLAGFPIPAQRAFIMVTVLFTAMLLDRRGITLRTLMIAAVLILLLFPESMFGASFQLSFAATLAIVSLFEWRRNWHIRNFVARHAVDIALTSLVATFATAPFIIYNFNRFAMFGVISNMIVIPLATFIIMPGMLISLLLMPLGWQAAGYAIFGWGVDIMIRLSQWVTSLPYASPRLPSLSDAGLLISAFGLLWLCLMTRRWRYAGVLFIAAGLSTILFYKPYDLMISDDGKKVAVRLEDGEFLFIRGRASSFDAQAWLRYHGQEDGLTRGDLPKDEKPDCDKVKCVFQTHGRRVAVALHNGKTEGMCEENAAIIISADRLDCKAPLLIDGAFLAQNGATALRFENDKIVVESATDKNNRRPWNPRIQ